MKRAIIVLITAGGLYGAVHAEEYRWSASRGSSHGTGSSAAVSPQPRQGGASRLDAAAHDPAQRAALEKERKRAVAMIAEALKKARERVRREAEAARQKRLAEEKKLPGKGKDAEKKQALPGTAGTGAPAAKGRAPERSVAVQ